MKEQRTSLFVKNQLPKFITDEYPNFVLFLEAYYEFLENEQYIENVSQKNNLTEKLKNLRYLSDIDKSLSDFEDQFFNTFAPSLPRDSKVSKEFLIKHILELYNSKGSINSYKLLFRMLFGENVQISYPKDNILRASDGRWVVESFLRVSPNIKSVHYGDGETVEFILAQEADDDVISVTIIDENNVTYDIPFYIKLELKKLIFDTPPPVGSKIYISYEFFNINNLINRKITGQQSCAYAIIEKIRNTPSYDSYYYQLFFNKKTLKGNFISGEKLYCDFFDDGRLIEIDLETLSSVSHLNIISGGASYNIGDPVIIVGDSVRQAIVIVHDVESGIIEDLGVINGGAGFQISSNIYSQNVSSEFFRAEVTTIDDTGTKTPNSITLNIDKISDYNTVTISSSDYGFPTSTINLSSTIESALSYDTLYDLGGMTSVIVQNSKIDSSLGFFGESPELQGIPILNKGAIGKVDIISGGTGYEVGDTIIFTRTLGDYSGNGASANVSLVESTTGAIKRVTVIDGGEGYSRENFPDVSVNSANGVGAVLQVTALMGEGATFNAMLPVDEFGRRKFAGEIKSFKILDQGVGYDTIPYVDLTGYGNGQALANVEINTSYEEIPGRWITSDSIISTEDRKLQGRDYYVDFTYILKSQVEFSKYKDILLKLIHPAGLRVYSEYDIVSNINVSSLMSINSNIINYTDVSKVFKSYNFIWYNFQDISTLFIDKTGILPLYLPGSGLPDPQIEMILDTSIGYLDEKIINYDFSYGLSGWNVSTEYIESNFELLNNKLKIYSGDSKSEIVYIPIDIELGKKYCLTCEISEANGPYFIIVSGSGDFDNINRIGGERSGIGVKSLYFDAEYSPCYIYLATSEGIGNYITIKSISLKEIGGIHAIQEDDRYKAFLTGRYNFFTGSEELYSQILNVKYGNYILSFSGSGTIKFFGANVGNYNEGYNEILCESGQLFVEVFGEVNFADFRLKNIGSNVPKYQKVIDDNNYDTLNFPLYLTTDEYDIYYNINTDGFNGTFIQGKVDQIISDSANFPSGNIFIPMLEGNSKYISITQWTVFDFKLSDYEFNIVKNIISSRTMRTYYNDNIINIDTSEESLIIDSQYLTINYSNTYIQ